MPFKEAENLLNSINLRLRHIFGIYLVPIPSQNMVTILPTSVSTRGFVTEKHLNLPTSNKGIITVVARSY